MIFRQLVLHDFGQYAGRNSVNLSPPDDERPVILFGGLNGAGKTTILDAIQLCLFGQRARCSNRNGMAYEQYLAKCIHDRAGAAAASIELEFEHRSGGISHRYSVRRSWRKTSKGCIEALDVFKDDQLDDIATNNWAEQIEEFIPARIAHLFFFDGEKVEAYAEASSASGLIETAIYNLLGLDLVERLDADLLVLEKRKSLEKADDESKEELQISENSLREFEERASEQTHHVASINTQLARLEAKLSKVEEAYRREGGHLFDQREKLEANHAQAAEIVRRLEEELREFAGGVAPFLLVRDQIAGLRQQGEAERRHKIDREVADVVAERDDEIVALLKERQAPDEMLRVLDEYLRKDRETRLSEDNTSYLQLSESGQAQLSNLAENLLGETEGALEKLIGQHAQAQEDLDRAARQLEAVPKQDALAEIVEERDQLKTQIGETSALKAGAQHELDFLYREIERQKSAIEKKLQARADRLQERNDLARLMRHSRRVRQTLEKFSAAMIERHIARIEQLVLNSFVQLLRKSNFVKFVRIDPSDFAMSIERPDGEIISPERLSQGERQLLAISILWGLAKASERALPTVVDTPLGRLDSAHRELLLANYFPHASHQMIILSTDEEIAGPYLESLAPYIGRQYELRFDEKTGATSILPGYFDGGLADAA